MVPIRRSRAAYVGWVGNLLVASGVSKVVSSVTLLRTVDVRAEPGRCVVVRGVNGAGKTTLLRILAGLTPASTGTVELDGGPVDERDPVVRAAVGALLGAPATYRDLTLRDHLELIDATWGRGGGDREERALAGLDRFAVAHLSTRFPHELSSGQSQLFRLACAFFRPATTLLLDEPEQRLDTGMRRLVADRIIARRAEGTTVVMACHDPDLTAAVADVVLDLEPADAGDAGDAG